MPASKHMIVIEKRRDVELRMLMAGVTLEHARDAQPRRTGRPRRTTALRENSATLSRDTKN